MLTLSGNEKVSIVVRKHWFVMTRTLILSLALLFIPLVVSFALPYLSRMVSEEIMYVGTNFFLSLYFALLVAFLFFEWTDYYLDTWIITNKRIIDVEQNGLFDRHVAEIPLSRVQDITIEVKGIIETFLHFGTIRIQTAGERDFFIHDVPHLQQLKDIILKGAEENRAQDQKEPPVTTEKIAL